jgi:hypothetical protein
MGLSPAEANAANRRRPGRLRLRPFAESLDRKAVLSQVGVGLTTPGLLGDALRVALPTPAVSKSSEVAKPDDIKDQVNVQVDAIRVVSGPAQLAPAEIKDQVNVQVDGILGTAPARLPVVHSTQPWAPRFTSLALRAR